MEGVGEGAPAGARARDLRPLATGLGAIALLGMWGSTQWIPSWADRLGAGDPAAKAHAQIATAAGSILGSALAAFVAEWLSRRRAFFLLSLLSLVACALLFRLPLAFGPLFLTLAFIAGAATAGFFGWLPLYLPELFPTRLRATGQGFAFNAGRLFAAAGTLFTGRLLDAFDEDYARTGAVTSLVYVLGLVLIWWCPETKGRPLPE